MYKNTKFGLYLNYCQNVLRPYGHVILHNSDVSDLNKGFIRTISIQ